MDARWMRLERVEYAVHLLSVLRAWIGTWVGAWASLAHALMAFVPVWPRLCVYGVWLAMVHG
jgi:hypothetical protein